MNAKRNLYFRWTPRTAKITLMYVVVVPSLIGYLAYKTDVSATRFRFASIRPRELDQPCAIG